MFGMFTEMFSRPKSNTPDSTIKPIMVADYLGTTSTDDRMLMEERAGSKKVITNDLIGLFNDYSNSRNRKFLDGIIGKNDGSFPITNPVKDKIYYYPVDKKYYKCKKSVSGAVNAPDATNFTEFSLFNFKGGVTGITMTGAATGTGSLNEVTGMMTVNTTVNYANITGKPSTMPNPHALTIKLNGSSGTTYSGTSAAEINITPASIGAQVAGSYALSNHNHDTVYSKTTHNHDDRYYTETEVNNKLSGYQPKGDYAASGHTHPYLPTAGGTITGNLTVNGYTYVAKDRGIKFRNTEGQERWMIRNNGGTEIGIGYSGADALPVRVYGSLLVNTDKAVWHSGNFDPSTKASTSHNHDSVYSKLDHDHNSAYAAKAHDHAGVYQPVGSYALSSHNHDSAYAAKTHNHSGVYAPVSHTHTSANISALTGYAKAASASAIAVTDTLNVALGKLEKALDGKAPTGNYSVVGHNHNDTYNTKSEITNLLAGKLGATANAVSASKLTNARTISVSGAVSGSNTFDGSGNMNISTTLNSLDASKITSGIISVDRLPKTALSDFIPVANKAARLALTKSQAQNGDTVKETDTKRMYLVIDDTKLSTEEGYQEYTTVVDWSVITGKPSTFQPISHTHTWAQISDRPSTMANPHALTISLNGKAQTAYTGSAAVSFNITPASIGAQVAGSYATASHNHSGVYAPVSHSHTIGQIGALAGYTKAGSVSAITTSDTILSAFGKLEKALDGKQAAGSYASSSHNHDSVYSKLGHAHAWGEITGKPSTFTPSTHNQASSTITAMTGYSKPSSTSAIGTGDSLNTAIGKLEKALDGKQASGSYAAANHNHSGVYAPVSHNHNYAGSGSAGGDATRALKIKDYAGTNNIEIGYSGNSLTASTCKYLAGYDKLANGTVRIKDITAAEARAFIGAQPAGSYAAASHNHSGVYAPASHSHSWDSVTGKPSSFTPSSHNQASSTINSMSGYSKPSTTSAIATTDTLNAAIGKLEKALDGKQAAGSYATASHNHSGVYQPAGSYAAASHTHPYLPTSGGTISGALTVTGQILSNADVVAYSDARMKTNVVKIEFALDKVSKISGYTYDMQGIEYGGQRQAGVLAQELKEVLPEAVITDDNGYYAVRYTNIIPLLIEALKEEKSKRESLEDEVMSLKEENKTLQERLAKIERMLDIK